MTLCRGSTPASGVRYEGRAASGGHDDEPPSFARYGTGRAVARPGRMDGSFPARTDPGAARHGRFARSVSGEPLMTLKVLAYESGHRGRRVVTSAETVTSALVMMGISPFFRAFGPQPIVEDWLAHRPEALAGLQGVLQRAHRGADFALAFAIHRVDPDAAVIHAATLLHEFAELLLWCHAPALALLIQRAQADDPELRSNLAQREVLNIELADLQRSLTSTWQLPALIADVAPQAQPTAHTSARIVSLGVRLARHTTLGWDNPAIPDDVAEIAEMLNVSPSAALDLVRNL